MPPFSNRPPAPRLPGELRSAAAIRAASRLRALMLRRRDARFTLGLTGLAFALAFWQLPGRATSDTKIDLYVDPVHFLANVASVWTNTTDLGEVHSSQYGGYLWPMGPFFALLHTLGISPWVAERLWLGAILALAAWGLLRLLDLLIGRPRGVAHLVAAAFYMINPYTVVFTARTTITLLGYAALPWLLLIVYRGIRVPARARSPRAWWWPAAFALIVTSTGGGVNAAVVFFMLLGPLALLVYEPAMGHVSWRAAGGFLARAAGLACSCRCGGSSACSPRPGSASTSCSTPSSRGRSGARTRSPSRCA